MGEVGSCCTWLISLVDQDPPSLRAHHRCARFCCDTPRVAMRQTANLYLDMLGGIWYDFSRCPKTFPSSSMAEQSAVNRWVVGSNPTSGAKDSVVRPVL